MPGKTVYDARTARRLRNFFTLTLNVLSERRANFKKPEHYQMPEWECAYIEQMITLIDTKLLGNFVLDNDENRCFLNAYEIAQRIYHDRIMNMHHYFLETSKMVDRCNDQVQDRPVGLILKLGVPRKKAA